MVCEKVSINGTETDINYEVLDTLSKTERILQHVLKMQ
jgi:hypothetical protein